MNRFFPDHPSLSHFSRVLWWKSVRERESWVRVRERETTAWGEWSLPPLIKLHPKPSSFFISTTHLSYLSRSTSVQFSSAQHSTAEAEWEFCVCCFTFSIYLVLLPMEIFPSKLIEGVVVVFAFSLRENKNDNDDDDMKSENSFYFISQFFFLYS